MHVVRSSSEPGAPAVRRKLDKYELVASIGAGGMAEVHLARLRGPMGFQKVVVLKTIHQHLAEKQEFLTMLLDEARISALIKHPRVVDIYDLGHADGTYFIAMEHLVGQPLSQVMVASRAAAPLDVYAVARIIADTAEGLDAAHELKSMTGESVELVHRDVSPGNVMVLYDGNVKILDFGIAKARGRLTESGLHTLKGKIGYVAPEQIEGGAVDRRSDIFALGVVLWEALTLRRLFHADSELAAWRMNSECKVPPPSTHRAEIPPELDAICLKATAREPGARYQTAAEMRDAIEDMLERYGENRGRAAIAAFMQRRFARQREAHERAIRTVASASELSDEPMIDIDLEREPRTPASAAEPTASEIRRAGTRVLLGFTAALALALIATGGGSYLARVRADSSPASPSARMARVVAPAQQAAPAEQAAPAVKPSPVPQVDEQATREPSPPHETASSLGDSSEAESAGRGRGPRRPAGEPRELARPSMADERSAEELTAEASRLFLQGKLAAAKELYKRAIRVRPAHAGAHRGLGLVYEKLGKSSKAVRSFQTYLKHAPNADDATQIRDRINRLR